VVVRIGLAIVLAIGVLSAAPRADAADATGEDGCDDARENTKQVGHDVVVNVREPGVATFDVTLTFEALGPGPICLVRNLDFPGVITSFAFRTDARWRKGRLRRRNPASPRGDRGARLPRKGAPWAVLDPHGHGALLATPAFLATGPVQVRYTFWAQGQPARNGHRWVYCPRDDDNDVEPFKIVGAASGAPIEVRPDEDNDPACSAIESREPPRKTLTARYGVYRPRPGTFYWWLDVGAPATLAPATPSPEPGPVLFVLDASRSQEANGGLATQLAIAEAYLANAPKAEVELLLVGREVERLFGRFVPAADFGGSRLAGLGRRPLGNGSFVDRGAAQAAELLVADGRPGRIVLFSDGEVRSSFDGKTVTAALRRAPPGTVVQIVRPRSAERDDVDHSWGALGGIAEALGGVSYDVSVGKKPHAGSPPLAALMRRLIAPDRVESIELRDGTGPDAAEWPKFADEGVAAPDRREIMAGDAISWRGLMGKPPPRSWRITGWVWGKKLEVRPTVDPVLQRRLPRLLATEDETTRCDEGSLDLGPAGLRGGFLSPDLVFWVPGAGVSELPGRLAMDGGDCVHEKMAPLGGGVRGGSWPAAGPKRDELPRELSSSARRCGSDSMRAKIETQGNEILDVTVEGGSDDQRRCAAEAIWAFQLPAKFNAHPYFWRLQTYDVLLSPAP
jgi:hypothetical protein